MFFANCKDCDADIPFESEEERDDWVKIHSSSDHTVTSGNKTPVIDTREELAEGYAISFSDLDAQIAFSELTFGPGERTEGIIDHITKELKEIEEAPKDLMEWVDIIILAIDGAWRAGFTSRQIIGAYHAKMRKNRDRRWPDWRTSPLGKAIEHIREDV